MYTVALHINCFFVTFVEENRLFLNNYYSDMKKLKCFAPLLICASLMSCMSSTDKNDSYLVLQVDTTQKYEQYSYVNEKGETVVPYNRYMLCYTDTIRTIGFVFKPDVGCVAINNKGKELFNVFMADNGNDYPVDGLFRILDENGKKMGVANMEGQVIVKPKYDAIFPFKEGFAAVAVGTKTVRPQDDPEHEYVVGGKWGFIDKQGKVVVPLEYDSLDNFRQFENGKVRGLKDGKWVDISQPL